MGTKRVAISSHSEISRLCLLHVGNVAPLYNTISSPQQRLRQIPYWTFCDPEGNIDPRGILPSGSTTTPSINYSRIVCGKRMTMKRRRNPNDLSGEENYHQEKKKQNPQNTAWNNSKWKSPSEHLGPKESESTLFIVTIMFGLSHSPNRVR